MSGTRVVVVDDQMLVRAGFVALLDAQPDLSVVGEAEDGEQAVNLVARLEPDVVLMDVRMPRLDGIAATERIVRAHGGRTSVLILTTFDLDEHVYAALRAGASGFLLKDTPPEEMVNAVRVVAKGEGLLAPSVTRRLIREFAVLAAHHPLPDATFGTLTEREVEVVVWVAKGLTNAAISQQIFVSEATVKTHLNRAMAKLNLSSRAQVVAAAYEAGLVKPGGNRRSSV